LNAATGVGCGEVFLWVGTFDEFDKAKVCYVDKVFVVTVEFPFVKSLADSFDVVVVWFRFTSEWAVAEVPHVEAVLHQLDEGSGVTVNSLEDFGEGFVAE